MDVTTEFALFVVAGMAGAVAAVSGFGIGSLLTPALALWMPTPRAVTLVAIPHLVATAIRWARLRGDVHGPTLRQFGVASASGALAGALLQGRLAHAWLTWLLAALLVLAGTTELRGRRVHLPGNTPWRLGAGLLSGLFGGLVGNQGGIRTAALLGCEVSPRQLVATATTIALLVDAARIPVYLWSDAPLLLDQVRLWLLLSAGTTLGTLAGVPVLSRIPARLYRRLLGVLLIGLGVLLVTTAG